MDLASLAIRYSDVYRPTIEVKVVVIGSLGCGKTSLVLRQMYKKCDLPKHISSTIGLSFLTSNVVLNDCLVRFQLWDTAGQERFRAMGPMYFRHADAALVVYDISNEQSFQEAVEWISKLQASPSDNDVILCLVANKQDLEDDRRIPAEVGKAFADANGVLFFETSALRKTGGVEQAFKTIGTMMYERHEKRRRAEQEMQKEATFSGQDSNTHRGGRLVSDGSSCLERRPCCP